MECAGRLRDEVRRAPLLAEEAYGPIRLSASFGIASYPDDAKSPDELLSRADEAMYRVKAANRDALAAAIPLSEADASKAASAVAKATVAKAAAAKAAAGAGARSAHRQGAKRKP
jgi:predicted signal transduction protein with EAL and GGDEF domain